MAWFDSMFAPPMFGAPAPSYPAPNSYDYFRALYPPHTRPMPESPQMPYAPRMNGSLPAPMSPQEPVEPRLGGAHPGAWTPGTIMPKNREAASLHESIYGSPYIPDGEPASREPIRVNKPNYMPASNPPPMMGKPIGMPGALPDGANPPGAMGMGDLSYPGAMSMPAKAEAPKSATDWGAENPLWSPLIAFGQGVSQPSYYGFGGQFNQGLSAAGETVRRAPMERAQRRLLEAQVGKATAEASSRDMLLKLYGDKTLPMAVRLAAASGDMGKFVDAYMKLDPDTQKIIAQNEAVSAALKVGATERAKLSPDIVAATNAAAADKAGAEKAATIRAETAPGAIAGQADKAGAIAKAESDAKGGTEYQNKAAAGASRAMRANQVLNGLEATGQNSPRLISWLTSEKSYGSFVASKAEQQYFQAAREFIASVLRVESGAAVQETEFRRYYGTYFPIPGDSPSVIAQKAAARDAIIRELSVQGGPVTARMPGSTNSYAPPSGSKNDPLGIR